MARTRAASTASSRRLPLPVFTHSVMASSALSTSAWLRPFAQDAQVLDLFLTHGRVVDFQDVNRFFLVEAIFVHADDGLRAGVDAGLGTGCSFLDTHLGDTGLDSLGHTAQLLDFLICSHALWAISLVRAST